MPAYGSLGEKAGLQPRGGDAVSAGGGGDGDFRADRTGSQAGRILLGADFDDCDHTFAERSAEPGLATLCRDGARGRGRRHRCYVVSLSLGSVWRWNIHLWNPERDTAAWQRLSFCSDRVEHRFTDRSSESALDHSGDAVY